MFKYNILTKKLDIEIQPLTSLQASTEAESEATYFLLILNFLFGRAFLIFGKCYINISF